MVAANLDFGRARLIPENPERLPGCATIPRRSKSVPGAAKRKIHRAGRAKFLKALKMIRAIIADASR